MCRIYYPFFKIEKSNPRKKYNHKINILALCLISDKILIPARHLLEMENDRFDILIKYKRLFHENIIYSRIPDNITNLRSYYESIKADYTDQMPEVIEIRINKIINELYDNVDNDCEKYNPLAQQNYYFREMKIFLCEYKINHRNIKGFDEIISFWNESTFITKEDFDPYLKDLFKNRRITKDTYRRIKKGSDLLYFLAGASIGQLKVSYDDYFEYKCIRNEIEATIANYNQIINKHYSPSEIIKFLKFLEVLEKEVDIEKLDIDDILYLRKQYCFDKFVKEYDKCSMFKDVDAYFEKKKNATKIICIIKSCIVSIALTCISTLLTGVITLSLVNSLIAAVILLVPTYFATYMFQKKYRYEIPGIEKLLDRIICCFDPVSLYLAKIKWRLSSKNL